MTGRVVLLIEDDPSDVELARRALEINRIPYRLVVAHNGSQALDLLRGAGAPAGEGRADPPALNLLDLNLPGMDGFEVLRAIRADDRLKRLPVVILSSSKREEDIADSYRLGANGYLRKPVDFRSFSEAMRQAGLFWLTINEPPVPQARSK
jgi:two-component system response regulator